MQSRIVADVQVPVFRQIIDTVYYFQKIQKKIQNSAARIVFQSKKRDHTTPLLQKLHWLSIDFRMQYKIATLCFKSFTEPLFPKYLSELSCTYRPS